MYVAQLVVDRLYDAFNFKLVFILRRFTRAWMGDFIVNLEQTLKIMLLSSDLLLNHIQDSLPRVCHVGLHFIILDSSSSYVT